MDGQVVGWAGWVYGWMGEWVVVVVVGGGGVVGGGWWWWWLWSCSFLLWLLLLWLLVLWLLLLDSWTGARLLLLVVVVVVAVVVVVVTTKDTHNAFSARARIFLSCSFLLLLLLD